jgi:hypothetical protein
VGQRDVKVPDFVLVVARGRALRDWKSVNGLVNDFLASYTGVVIPDASARAVVSHFCVPPATRNMRGAVGPADPSACLSTISRTQFNTLTGMPTHGCPIQ